MPNLRAGVSVAETEYGVALLDERSGQYWMLNPTGAIVLRALLAGDTAEHAADKIAKEYAVDVETAIRDASELERDIRSANLVEW